MKEHIARILSRTGFRKPSPRKIEVASAINPVDRELVSRIRSMKLTYLSDRKLAAVAATCRAIEASGLPGLFLEAGCALGGSAILIASLKNRSRSLRIYDVFGMIPPPTAQDTKDVHDRYKTIVEGNSVGIDNDEYYGYRENLYEVVVGNFKAFNLRCEENSISLIKGLLQDTLVLGESVAFAHIDVDWYEPVSTCLHRIFPRLQVGGSMILDDYFDWGGCRKAVDEYLTSLENGVFSLDDSAGSLKVTRTRK